MRDGDTSAKIASDDAQCASCQRTIYANELYGAHGLCSQCLEDGTGEHHGG